MKRFNRVDYNSPIYRKARAEVYKRDKGKCRMPGCKNKGKHVHHIKKWADFPELRYLTSNLILLCKRCHISTFHKEEQFAPLFLTLIQAVPDVDILKIKYGIE